MIPSWLNCGRDGGGGFRGMSLKGHPRVVLFQITIFRFFFSFFEKSVKNMNDLCSKGGEIFVVGGRISVGLKSPYF
jgi:hypothetical protein